MPLSSDSLMPLSEEEQQFLAETTTNSQVVQDQESAEAMVAAEKAKAEGWAEEQEAREKYQREKKIAAAEIAAFVAEERYQVSVAWAKAGVERTLPRLELARERASGFPSAEARAWVLYYEQALDGWQCVVRLYESRERFYQMNGRWIDILLASQNYPEKSNPYYWTKKGMPKLRKLRQWTGIRVTRYDRNGLWEWPEEADKWI